MSADSPSTESHHSKDQPLTPEQIREKYALYFSAVEALKKGDGSIADQIVQQIVDKYTSLNENTSEKKYNTLSRHLREDIFHNIDHVDPYISEDLKLITAKIFVVDIDGTYS